MSSYTVFLLDDNEVYLSDFKIKLEQYLKTLPVSFDIYAFTDAGSLETEAALCKPDLIIADIQLADSERNGISVLQELRRSGCEAQIVFLTDYLHYAPEIFDVRPLYFILKSEAEEKIPKAMDQFLQTMGKQHNKLTLRFRKTEVVVLASDILYIERCLRKTIVHCKEKDVHVSASLSVLAQQLPENAFCMSHQSILVNLQNVKSFSGASVILVNDIELPISRLQSEKFRRAMALYLSQQ